MSTYDDASLIMYPSGYKEDKLYSLKPTDGSGDLDFTRASTATRVNAEGLIEESPVNLLQQSETFDNAYWVKTNTSVTANATTAPNGTTTADALIESVTTTTHYLINIPSVAANASTYYTASYFVKYNGRHFQILGSTGSEGGGYVNFDLLNGVVGNSDQLTGTIEAFANGWYRCTGTNISTAVAAEIRLLPFLCTSPTSARAESYLGNGTSGIYIYGAQVNIGATAKTYFPTTDRLNVPRIDYTGGGCGKLLLEPQRTNLVTYSEQFDNAAWNKTTYPVTITANQTASPTGYVDADLITPTAASSRHAVGQTTISATGGVVYTISAFFKKAVSQYVVLTDGGDTNWHIVTADLDSGTITNEANATGTITNYGNGWYRVTCTFTRTNTSTIQMFLGASNVSNATSLPAFNDVTLTTYVYGAQAEAGSYSTSLINTSGTSVTRLADSASKDSLSVFGTNVGSFFVDAEGPYFDGAAGYLFDLSDNVNSSINRFAIYSANSTNLTLFTNTSGNFVTSVTARKKIAVIWNGTNTKLYLNGVKVLDFTYANANPTSINLNNRYNETQYGNSKFNQVLAFPTALSDAEAIALTTL